MNERTKGMRGVAGAFAAILFCGVSAFAPTAFAQSAPAPAHTVRATGEATVSAAPDQAELTLAVLTRAPTAVQAAADNARQTEQVIAALKAALEPSAEVKTAGYSIAPNYVYPAQGGEPKLNGYNATNTILVTTHDLNRVGPTIDAAVKVGVNTIQGLQFSVKDDAALQAEALRRAAGNAQRRGTAIAEGLGRRVLNVLSAEEGSAVVRPVLYEANVLRNASAQTPVEPGTVEVRATVTVTLSID